MGDFKMELEGDLQIGGSTLPHQLQRNEETEAGKKAGRA